MDYKLILLQALAAESFIGCAIIYFKRDNRTFSIGVISFFLLSLGLIFLQSFVMNYFGVQNNHPLIVLYSYLLAVLCLSLPPTFYLYTLSLVKTKKDIIHNHKIIRHYIPSIILLIINLFSFVALYSLAPGSQNFVLLTNVLTYSNFISLFIIFLIQNVFYIFLAWQLYFKEKIILKETQSKKTNLTIWWLKWFIILFTILISLLYLFQIKPLLEGKLVFRIFTFIYISLIIFFGRNNYQFILDNIKSDTLDDKKRDEIKVDLLAFIEKEKPYLDQDLTIKSLAHGINTNSKYLSYLINKEFDCNFSSYINSFRIGEAKKYLSDEKYDIYTIESIAKMTGFKSKSTFNAVFKKETLLTPSQFKQQFKKEK